MMQGFQKRALVIYAAMTLLTLGVGLFVYWSVAGNDVLEIHNAPVPVRSIREHPQADGVIILKIDYCKKMNATGRVRTSFVSPSREVFLPVSEDKQPAQCNAGQKDPIELPILIPKDLPAGIYRIHFRAVYQVNPLKEVIEEFDSKEFEIVETPTGAEGKVQDVPSTESN